MSERHASRSTVRARFLKSKLAVRLTYVVISLLVLGLGLQEQGYGWSSDECDLRSSSEVEFRWLNSVYAYVLARMTNGTTERVSVLTIDPSLQRILQNVCPARGFTADLVRDLAAQGPAVIAIDKFYGETACPDGDADTTDLQNVAKELPSRNVVLVVGASTHAPAEEDTPSTVEKKKSETACLVENPQLDLGPGTHRGLTRLNQNVLRLPLRWPVLAKDGDRDPVPEDASESFSLVAATLGNPDLRQDRKLTAMIDSPQQPYANLTGHLEQQNASDVLCSADNWNEMDQKYSLKCGGQRRPGFDVRGTVVVVGAQSDTDYPSVLGKGMYGYQLQARYIAALLAGGYLRQVPFLLVLAGVGCFYIVIELLIPHLRIHHHPTLPMFHIHNEWLWTFGAWLAMMLIGIVLPIMLHRFPPLGVLLALTIMLASHVLARGWDTLNENAEHPAEGDLE